MTNSDTTTSNSSDPAIQPEYGYDQPSGKKPYLYGNQNNQNSYGNQQYPENPYGGQQHYPNHNIFGNQNVPSNQNGYRPNYGNPGIFGNQRQFPGLLGNQFPNNQNVLDQPPNENGGFSPNQNIFGGMQNRPSQNLGNQFDRPIDRYPNGGRQQTPNQNIFNNPHYGNRPSYPSSSFNGFPWGNQHNPGYQRYPQSYLPNQVKPGTLNPDQNIPLPGYQKNPQSNLPNQVQPVISNPGLNTANYPNNFLPEYQKPQTNVPGIVNPGLPSESVHGNIIPGYQNPQTNLPKQIQPGHKPNLPSTNGNPSYQTNPIQNQNSFGYGGVDKGDKTNQDQQCNRMKTSFPASPETGCCGRDMSDADKITGEFTDARKI